MKILTEFPLALDSLDYTEPIGATSDDHCNPLYVDEVVAQFDDKVSYLELGCAGGSIISHLVDKGHDAYGIDGTDHPIKVGRPAWGQHHNTRLFTCDLSKPFIITDAPKFDVISAWEFMEHIPTPSLMYLLSKMCLLLKDNGIIILGVSYAEDAHHLSVFPQETWNINYFSKLFDILPYSLKNKYREDYFGDYKSFFTILKLNSNSIKIASEIVSKFESPTSKVVFEDNIESFLHSPINIPEDITQIRIDVGLAGEAPNSAIWLSETNDRFVVGIEPLKHHWNMLIDFDNSNTTRPYPTDFSMIQLKENVVKNNRNTITSIGGRFLGVQCAIDNVSGLQETDFYEMDRDQGKSGSSSILKPSPQHPASLRERIKVKVINLETILDKLLGERFPYIEHIKTDCEFKDFDVVKSCGKHLDKIVFLTSEFNPNIHHVEGACDNIKFIEYMLSNNFSVLDISNGNINFINNRYINEISAKNLTNHTLGL